MSSESQMGTGRKITLLEDLLRVSCCPIYEYLALIWARLRFIKAKRRSRAHLVACNLCLSGGPFKQRLSTHYCKHPAFPPLGCCSPILQSTYNLFGSANYRGWGEMTVRSVGRHARRKNVTGLFVASFMQTAVTRCMNILAPT